jgi:hypothetical protein
MGCVGRSVQLIRRRTNPVEPSDASRPVGIVAQSGNWLYHLLAKLERPWARQLAIAVALMLVVPTLTSGFALDDYVLLDQMSGPSNREWAGSMPFDLFRWMDPEHNHRLIDGAGLPWWTFDQARCSFLRPMSSLTHALDHWLWPRDPFWMHMQSLTWFGLLLALAAKLYSELLESRWVAAVACAMFALDSAHGEAVGWISNRNALITGAFAIAALLCHHRHRSGAGATLAVAAWSCFGLSLISGELGVGVAGYLLAYALLFEQGSLRKRLVSILPYSAVLAAWAAIRSAAHYGTYGLGVYVDPLREPMAFVRGLPTRSLLLISSQVSRICADLYDWVPASLQPLLLSSAIVVCGGVLWFAWPSLVARRSIRFWAGGAALSVLPLAATLPSDRLLTLVGVGVMPTLAQAIHDALLGLRSSARPDATRAPALRGGCAIGLALVHFVVDPVMLPMLALSPALIAKGTRAADASLPIDAALRGQTVIVAEVPDSASLSYVPVMRAFNGKPRPDKLYWLAATPEATRFERRGPNVLRVTSSSGFFDRRWESRSQRFPFRKGDRVELSEVTVTVVALTKDGRPAVCDFVFAHPLESPAYLWRTWRGGRLAPFVLPSQGHSETLSAS